MIYNSRYHILFFTIIIFPYILSDIYYMDDLFRSQLGYFSWSNDGRPLADIFYKAITANAVRIPDIYPLPLFISGILLSLLFNKVMSEFNINDKLISASLMGLMISSPLFVSNFLFRYDGAFMLLSVFFSLIPFSIDNNKKYLWFVLSTLSLIAALATYQASINVFIGMVGIKFIYLYNKKSLSLKSKLFYPAKCVFILILAYLAYSNFILKIFPTNEYFNNYNKIIDLNKIGINIFIDNIKVSYAIFYTLIESGLLYPLIITSLILVFFILKKAIIEKNIGLIIVFLLSLFVVIFSIPGITLVGKNTMFFARVFIGVMPFLIFSPLLVILFCENKRIHFFCIFLLLIPITALNYASINSTRTEIKNYNFISYNLFSDINRLHLSEKNNYMILGKPKLTKETSININAYPVIKYILPFNFNNGYDGGRFTLMKNGFTNIIYVNNNKRNIYLGKTINTPPISSNNIYDLYHIDNNIIIKFK